MTAAEIQNHALYKTSDETEETTVVAEKDLQMDQYETELNSLNTSRNDSSQDSGFISSNGTPESKDRPKNKKDSARKSSGGLLVFIYILLFANFTISSLFLKTLLWVAHL